MSNQGNHRIRVLLVDDEADFRDSARKVLDRRGFVVFEAVSGEEALVTVQNETVDIMVLDLRMSGISGIETLKNLREQGKNLPVVILTGHGSYQDALAGIQLGVVDFIQKPVDVDRLADRLRDLVKDVNQQPLRERSIQEMMVSPSLYPTLYIDQPVVQALETLREVFFQPHDPTSAEAQRIRSALVYERNKDFVGLIRFSDLLKLVLPPFLGESPYTTYFTGMFLAQCKVIGNTSVRRLMRELISAGTDAPLMYAIHLMVLHRLINLLVMSQDKLVGILREKDVIIEIANIVGISKTQ